MKFKVKAELQYYVPVPSTLILNIHALRTPGQAVLEEVFSITPYMKVEELAAGHGENRFIRFEIPGESQITVSYAATVDNSFRFTDHSQQNEIPVAQLDPAVLPFLYPSRYCQSDKLYRLAGHKFGKIENPFLKVCAITDWIHRNIEYLSGSTNAQTSACETLTEQAGVCRDFAHLGIALCRALTIPARYFTGYAYQLYPPDFHACFEAYLGGDWVLFDPTKLVPLNSIVKIATGRDAADTAVASIFGNVICNNMDVSCELADDNWQPFYYLPSGLTGVSYL